MQRAARGIARLAAGGARGYEAELWSRARNVLPVAGVSPAVAVDAWVAPNATVVGSVIVSDQASVWFGAVVRGDLATVKVGAFSSVGDRAVVSTARTVPTGLSPDTVIGRHVTIGATSLLRSVVVEDEAVIGVGCVLMEGCVVETGAVLQDGTLLPPGRRIPARQVWGGSPAKYVRDCTYDDAVEIVALAEEIASIATQHAAELLPELDFSLQKEANARRAALAAITGGAATPSLSAA